MRLEPGTHTGTSLGKEKKGDLVIGVHLHFEAKNISYTR